MTTDPETLAAPAATPRRRLRRSATDRVGAGVAGGLGEYTDTDPVLFRVLFAVAAFFGGAGLLAYAVAWAVIPLAGTEHAPVDGWVDGLRRRRVPVWLVAGVGALVLWAVAFSWWSPRPLWPLLALVLVPVLLVGTRDGGWRRNGPAPVAAAAAPAVTLDKDAAAAPPPWAAGVRAWLTEARQASRARRRRSWPLLAAALTTLVAALTSLGVTDALVGIWLTVYFWVLGGIALVTLVAGVALRRTPWSLLLPLLIGLLGTAAFGGTHASLHDGIGQKIWTPTTSADVRGDYRLAFGQGVLDLRQVRPRTAHDIHVTLGAGQIRLLLPNTMNATVVSDVRLGDVMADGSDPLTDSDETRGDSWRGIGTHRMVRPPDGATGPAVTIHVAVANGEVSITHG
jgi:phage shock protein PspC (stress-responsive transcriptional regulator)